MSAKEDYKTSKSKKTLQGESGFYPVTPEKKDNDFSKTFNLRDLSPYSPVYRTIKRSYDTSMVHGDLAIIETPLAISAPKSFIQEVQGKAFQISKLLVWEEEEE